MLGQEPSFELRKYHFMVTEGIVLRHRISVVGLEVDQAKVSIIKTLLPPTTVKGIRSFLGHAVFIEDLLETSPKLQDHYVGYWKRRPDLILMQPVTLHLKRSNLD